jgi:hypothetical protein
MYYNLICIFICTPMWTKFYSCIKWVLQFSSWWDLPLLVGRVTRRSTLMHATWSGMTLLGCSVSTTSPTA